MNRKTSTKQLKAALLNLELAKQANINKVTGIWKCAECQTEKRATAHQKRQKYCSKECMAKAYTIRLKGINNPHYSNANYRVCKVCGKKYQSYQKTTKFCSMKCRDVEGLSPSMRMNAKKDANHNKIVSILKKGGAIVKDLSRASNGIPDLAVWHMKQWHLVEIKNPETSYGKKGLSKSQQKFADEWNGGPVFIIRTEDEAEKFLIGEFDDLIHVAGGKPK